MPHTYFQYVKIYITGRSGSKVGDNQIISQKETIRNKSERGNTYDSYRNHHAAQVA